MEEKLLIKNFAGIKEVELTLSNINILIGPQASGKSVCAKSLYFFKWFVRDLINAIVEEKNEQEFKVSQQEKFKNYFPPSNWGKSDFSIKYSIGKEFIQISGGTQVPNLDYSPFFSKLYARGLKTLKKAIKNQPLESEYNRPPKIYVLTAILMNEAASRLGDVAKRLQRFIPAGRSFFAVLQSSIFSFLSSNKALDPFLADFGSFYETLKARFLRGFVGPKKEQLLRTKIDKTIQEILGGRYTREKGIEFLEALDGRKTNIANSSSGQQEMLPLAIILGTIPFLAQVSGYSIYIEEPEAHLFPTAQKKIVELISTIYNAAPNTQFIITTHSPYILTAFNNLIQAKNVEQHLKSRAKKKALYQIVPKEQLLSFDDVQAYALKDGKSSSLMSPDTRLISAEILDAVSDDLAIQFDNLLGVE